MRCLWKDCADELVPTMAAGMSQVFCAAHLETFWVKVYGGNPDRLIARRRHSQRHARLGSLVAR